MYYNHLCGKDFVPIIKKVRKKGRGFVALVVNESTGFCKEITFTELNNLLNRLQYGYRVSSELEKYINSNDVYSIPLLCRLKNDLVLKNCFIEK